MLNRVIYRYLHVPTSKLEFKKGMCWVLKDEKIERAISMNIGSAFVAPMIVLFGLKFKAYSILSAVAFPAFPFIISNYLFYSMAKSVVNEILLHNDGKTVTLRTCCSAELQIFKIEELKFSDPGNKFLGAFYKAITLPDNEVLFIPKIAEILHKDVLEKIMEGEEIHIDENDKEDKEDKEDKDEDNSEKNE
ncbi:hypothetical protein SteCoe_14767 [Stentor coeruleus]|uniref:Uncharacterized protein n=1 Tax=Stentor coeruleus TaxID=5963 RepID=A0A1R2C549_9CILI|nr:hypothetical protein SteCoe_14767 [Stentor coeruleus]